MFIDDVLIYLAGEDKHEKHFLDVLQTLIDKYLYAKSSKCEFWIKEVVFLGHILSAKGVTDNHSIGHGGMVETILDDGSAKFHGIDSVLSNVCEEVFTNHHADDKINS